MFECNICFLTFEPCPYLYFMAKASSIKMQKIPKGTFRFVLNGGISYYGIMLSKISINSWDIEVVIYIIYKCKVLSFYHLYCLNQTFLITQELIINWPKRLNKQLLLKYKFLCTLAPVYENVAVICKFLMKYQINETDREPHAVTVSAHQSFNLRLHRSTVRRILFLLPTQVYMYTTLPLRVDFKNSVILSSLWFTEVHVYNHDIALFPLWFYDLILSKFHCIYIENSVKSQLQTI